jgi:uncharacterized RDD family membrane protein YckC
MSFLFLFLCSIIKDKLMLTIEFSHAGLGVRVIAFAFDYIIIASYLIFIMAIGLLVNVLFPTTAHELFGNSLSGQITGFLIITLPVNLYFILFEFSAWHATWGKGMKGLQVTRTDGARLTILRASSRTFLKFIPWELAHTCIWQISFTYQEPPCFNHIKVGNKQLSVNKE